MTDKADIFWKDLARKVRRTKGLSPVRAEEVEAAPDAAPDIAHSEDEIEAIVDRVTSGPRSRNATASDVEWTRETRMTANVEAGRSEQPPPDAKQFQQRRRLMYHIARYSGLAAAATVLLSLGVWFFVVDKGHRTAFASVLENVTTAESVSFVLVQKFGDLPENNGKLFFQGDRIRFELFNG